MFSAALREVLLQVRVEPNCIQLHVGQSVSEPDFFVLSEGWRDLSGDQRWRLCPACAVVLLTLIEPT
ncbi:putative quinol monooxygenase [Amycolatopsis sp. lyj-23]|uniref:putative quinol monooxygenase n=1 Tax=Amycolatopsis sp. lyj-23 TaxID=2789283 RepID=UPI00397BED7C